MLVSKVGMEAPSFSRRSSAELGHQPRVSSAGGIWKAVETCTEIGGTCFAMFLGSQRSWKRSPLDHKAAARFQEQRSLHRIDPAHILPHGSYLMNCGSPKTGLSGMGGCLWPLFVFFILFFFHKLMAVEMFNSFTFIFSIISVSCNHVASDSSCQLCPPSLQMCLKRVRSCWWMNWAAAASWASPSTTSTQVLPWAWSPLSSVWKR